LPTSDIEPKSGACCVSQRPATLTIYVPKTQNPAARAAKVILSMQNMRDKITVFSQTLGVRAMFCDSIFFET
jgi:hypothetical protein